MSGTQNGRITNLNTIIDSNNNLIINNVFNNDDYSTIADSLITILNSRIKEARIRPDGIGRQIKNAKPNFEPKRINSTKKSKY